MRLLNSRVFTRDKSCSQAFIEDEVDAIHSLNFYSLVFVTTIKVVLVAVLILTLESEYLVLARQVVQLAFLYIVN